MVTTKHITHLELYLECLATPTILPFRGPAERVFLAYLPPLTLHSPVFRLCLTTKGYTNTETPVYRHPLWALPGAPRLNAHLTILPFRRNYLLPMALAAATQTVFPYRPSKAMPKGTVFGVQVHTATAYAYYCT